ncbi:JAB domain-containing protein [Rufibacter tibetensis]|uniref:JAB domain-containing protein n=1 Tax=Rufibacter tibetensis TaxID=512763 RepID=UPI000781C3DC|nr:JAB domain-containing protein [Rufibacter tibetensis]
MEQFKVLLLNRNNRVLGEYGVSTGGVSGTVVDIKLILAAALLCCASAIILGHNYPSGNTQPSTVDKAMTKRVREAAAQMDIAVLDHIILTVDTFYSFADDGELQPEDR